MHQLEHQNNIKIIFLTTRQCYILFRLAHIGLNLRIPPIYTSASLHQHLPHGIMAEKTKTMQTLSGFYFPQITTTNFEPRSELFNLVCCQHRIIPQTGDNTIYHHAHLHTRTSQVHTEKEIWIIFARKPPFRSFSPHMTFMSYGLKISGWNSDFT